MFHPVLYFLLTEHAHEYLVDPGEDADDVEGGEGDVQEEPDADLEALVLAALPDDSEKGEGEKWKLETVIDH